MTHGSLFSGIGGFDLAAEWMGWENVFHCEWNEFGQKILKQHFPNSIGYGDITKTDFTIHRGGIDILTGGFPCQPYSMAGKRKGKADDRHLWPEMLRAIREVQPCWVIGENVPGLISWSKGMVFHEVQSDLETAGFEVLTPFILPACGLNAPHKRDRLWVVAYSDSNANRDKREQDREANSIQGISGQAVHAGESFGTIAVNRHDPNTNIAGIQKSRALGHLGEIRQNSNEFIRGYSQFDYWRKFPNQSPVSRRNDGVPNRLDRIKALGNAIVPQVAHQIFKAIEQYENL